MLQQLLKPALIVFSVTLPAWLIIRIIAHYKKRELKIVSLKRESVLFLFYVYIICVLLLTMCPVPIAQYKHLRLTPVNFIPLVNTIKEFVENLSSGKNNMVEFALQNIIGNIILFIPLGILLPLISNKFHSLKKMTVIAFLFSLFIEFIQFISFHFGIYRTADIDDIILNILGAVLGFIVVKQVVFKTAPCSS
jgi:glycopeptide antibiotics resistance protein